MKNNKEVKNKFNDHCDFRELISIDYAGVANHLKNMAKIVSTSPSKTIFPQPHYATLPTHNHVRSFSNTMGYSRTLPVSKSKQYNFD